MLILKKISLFFVGFFITQTLAWANHLPHLTEMVKKNSALVVNISIHHHLNTALPPLQTTEGSGFIISPDGYIVTNRHVIQNADKIFVRFKDRRELIAKLIGEDKRTDLALLKVTAINLPKVKFGNPKKLKVGEWVVAIGSAFGFEQSVTAGIVSGKGRNLPNELYVSFIQTDVAINPGNSGGPLFNLHGKVMGMNSQIFSKSGGYQGISFAIPINVVMNVVNQLKKTGKVARGWMGVRTQDVTYKLAKSFEMRRPYGALISEITPAGPAEKAGFQISDIVIDFNGEAIETSNELPPKVGLIAPNEMVSVDIIRQGERKTLKLEVGLLPENTPKKQRHRPILSLPKNTQKRPRLPILSLIKNTPKPPKLLTLGLTFNALTFEDKKILEIPFQYGVLIHSVIPSSPAFISGIKTGDVLLKINNKWVHNLADANNSLNLLSLKTAIPIVIQRHGKKLFLKIRRF